MARGWWTLAALVVLGCGARSGMGLDDGLDSFGDGGGGGGNGSGNGGSGSGSGSSASGDDGGDPWRRDDAGGGLDGALFVDGAACTIPVEQFGAGGDGSCKVGLMWSCGGVDYRVGGGCQPDLGAKFPGVWGACFVNGGTSKSISDPTTACSCTELHKLLTQMVKECGFVLPGSGQ